MSNYIISLKPITPYFFGSENTFGEDNVNYFTRSNFLPQQTTLLGFLRYEVLAQNELLGCNQVEENWKGLIGGVSFQNKNGVFTPGFGAIKNISPLFLSNGSEHFIPQAMDWALCKHMENVKSNCKAYSKKLAPVKLSFINGFASMYSYRPKMPVLTCGSDPYDPKYGLKSLWVQADGNKMKQWDYKENFDGTGGFENGFFIEQQQTGIHRKIEKKSNETGDFYKQVFYKLADDFAFTFYVEINLPADKKFGSRIVTMGGERSTFYMKAEIANDSFESRFTSSTFSKNHRRNIPSLVLTSDAYVTPDILSLCDFAITDSVAFRNIVTRQEDKGDYARMDRAKSEWKNTLKKTDDLLYLLKRGSIFYAEDMDGIKGALENTAFKNIGYNHFIEIQSN